MSVDGVANLQDSVERRRGADDENEPRAERPLQRGADQRLGTTARAPEPKTQLHRLHTNRAVAKRADDARRARAPAFVCMTSAAEHRAGDVPGGVHEQPDGDDEHVDAPVGMMEGNRKRAARIGDAPAAHADRDAERQRSNEQVDRRFRDVAEPDESFERLLHRASAQRNPRNMPAGKGRGANAPRRLEPRNALKLEPRNTRTTRITKPSERTSSRGTHGKSSHGVRGRHGSQNPLSGHPAAERTENRAAEYADDTDHKTLLADI